MKARHILAATAALPLLIACQPGTPPPNTTNTAPTTTSPSTPTQEQLFNQASNLYRKISTEVNALEAAGGAKELPTSLKQYVTGELEKNLHAVYIESWPQQRKQRTGPAPAISWIKAYTGSTRAGAITSTIACVDARKSAYRTGGHSPQPGGVQHEILFYALDGGSLKAFDSAWEDASAC